VWMLRSVILPEIAIVLLLYRPTRPVRLIS
jgi:hypothetical protein